jgi:hypothetical protein
MPDLPDDDYTYDYDESIASPNAIRGKDEMNLAEFPFGILKRQGDAEDTYVYEGTITTRDGTRHQQRWEVHGLGSLGLPSEYDERVLIALMAVTASHNFQNRKVPFSVYQILQIMGVGTGKRDYLSVERALKRLIGVTIFAEGAFWDQGEHEWVSKSTSGFHILEKYWLGYQERNDTIREQEGVPAYIIWSNDLWKSIKNGYIKTLDLQFYFSLETPMSRRLYRFLDKRLYYREQYQIDVYDLSGRLGMSRYPYASKIIEKLRPALEELKARGFLKRYETIKHRGYTRLFFERTTNLIGNDSDSALPPLVEPQGKTVRPAPKATARTTGTLDERKLVEAEIIGVLMKLGYKAGVAKRLAGHYEEDYILQKIDYLDYVERTLPRTIRKPLAWLTKALDENYSEPEGYRAYRARQLMLEEETVETNEPQLTLDLSLGNEDEAPAPLDDESVISDAERSALWADVLAEIKLQVTQATFDNLFAATQLLRLDAQQALIQVRSVMVQEWIEARQMALLERTFQRRYEHPVELCFTVA